MHAHISAEVKRNLNVGWPYYEAIMHYVKLALITVLQAMKSWAVSCMGTTTWVFLSTYKLHDGWEGLGTSLRIFLLNHVMLPQSHLEMCMTAQCA